MKESRKIAEGLALLETVIFLDSEGMQCPSTAFRYITLTCKVSTSFSFTDGCPSSKLPINVYRFLVTLYLFQPQPAAFSSDLFFASASHRPASVPILCGHAFPYISTIGASHDLLRTSGHTKGRDGRGLQEQEVTMKLVTRFELAAKNENELHALLRNAFNALAGSDADTYQRRNALASIENIQNELASRAPCL